MNLLTITLWTIDYNLYDGTSIPPNLMDFGCELRTIRIGPAIIEFIVKPNHETVTSTNLAVKFTCL